MKEIKFRFWDEVYKTMIIIRPDVDAWYGASPEGKDNHHLIFRNRPTKDCCYDRRVKNVKLIQFTGLKDRKGVEIYECDIVRYFEYNGHYENIDAGLWHVSWDDTEPCFMIDQGGRSISLEGVTDDEYEAIGNIYENPELMN